ncbi:hypothetical protein T439DRAFT_347559 [Meredithblackwellia eburnea MCA 4105]
MQLPLIKTGVVLASILSVISGSPVPDTNSQLFKRAGPSGNLAYPVDGTVFSNYGNYGKINFAYSVVTRQPHLDQGVQGDTLGVDITLEPMYGNTNPSINLATAVTDTTWGGDISATFSTLDACGSYRFVVNEWQSYGSPAQLIHFRAAAPAITIQC